MLTPYQVSQEIRKKRRYVCSTWMGDPELPIEHYRGYMVRYHAKPNRSPEEPEHYICVTSLRQTKQWIDLVWIKEILGISDGTDHWTTNKLLLGHMLDHRDAEVRSPGTPLNVMADQEMDLFSPWGARSLLLIGILFASNATPLSTLRSKLNGSFSYPPNLLNMF